MSKLTPAHMDTSLFYRMVEDELFPALHYFGIRFYAYNPVRACIPKSRTHKS